DFGRGKTRLATVLDAGRRIALARSMLGHVIQTALEASAPALAGVAVVTDSEEVARFATAHGAVALADPPEPAGAPPSAAPGRLVGASLGALVARGAHRAVVRLSGPPPLAAPE